MRERVNWGKQTIGFYSFNGFRMLKERNISLNTNSNIPIKFIINK